MSSVREWPANTICRLIEVHPALFAGRQFEGLTWMQVWYSIADRLCGESEKLLGDSAERFRPTRAKHKWGSWRLYLELALVNDEPESTRTGPFKWDVVAAWRQTSSQGRMSRTPVASQRATARA